jgi:hypothetical protein
MEITLETFKKLLDALKNQEIGLKVKTHTGWTNGYLQIIGFIASVNDQEQKTFGGIVLSNMAETEGVLINNISTITAFELESTFEQFEANKVYTLRDNMSLKALIID